MFRNNCTTDETRHIIAYDYSGSTCGCFAVDNEGKTHKYFDFIENLVETLKRKYNMDCEKYIAWNHEAKITSGIEKNSSGGTDPSDAFRIIAKRYQTKNHIHLITDGDIYASSDALFIKNDDLIDIYYIGTLNHNIKFYQGLKRRYKERCNVYINDLAVNVYEVVKDGELLITEDEINELLNHDYADTTKKCAAFDKLVATVATYCADETYKEVLKKTLANLIKKSKGNLENEYLDEKMTIQEILTIINNHKNAVVPAFDAAISNLLMMIQNQRVDSFRFLEIFFLKSLTKQKNYEILKFLLMINTMKFIQQMKPIKYVLC